MRPTYRIRQFILSLNPKVAAEETILLGKYLSSSQRELFWALDARDQRHSLNVFHQLAKQGYTERVLLQAALLHDIGKARGGLSVWHRVAIVILKEFWPAFWQRISSADEGGWRRPFSVYQRHGELGAEMIARTGGDPRLVELVRRHDTPGEDPLALALHEADEAN